MISLDQAQRRILAACAALPAETIALETAPGRVLATDVRATADLVPFARSAMDGYAVRAADTLGAPVALPVRATVYAEAGFETVHAARTATAIATGAPLPAGADAVVPFERVVRERDQIVLASAVHPGAHVFPPGDDARRGDLLAAAGAPLTPGTLALLASAGHARLRVVRRPRVAIVCSGAELVGVADTPGFGQIRNSNGSLVAATLAAFGAEIVRNAQTSDERGELRSELAGSLGTADLLITTGGASVGARDLVKPLLRELGVAFAFESVALRPARPTAFGWREQCRVAVLAGNPAAVFVALHELVRPAVYGLGGHTSQLRLPRVRARLAGRLHAKENRTYLPFVRLRFERDGLVAVPLDNQCSALTRTASDASGFAVVEAAADCDDGALVAVDVYDWPGVRGDEALRYVAAGNASGSTN